MSRPDLGTAPRVWLLNFDAEDELERGSGHTASAGARARMETLVPLVASLTKGDLVLPQVRPDGGDAQVPAGTVGHAWCPTPAALRRLAQAGAVIPEAPPLEVLRHANHRRFSAELGPTLPSAGFFTDEARLRAHLGKGSPTGSWVLKRPFAFAGRGRIRVRDDARDTGELEAASAWIRASLARGGLDVSPWMVRVGDYALHGFVQPDGRVHLSAPTVQMCDDEGHWLRSTVGHDLVPAELHTLRNEAGRTGASLAGIGYFGPFGIDAFRYAAAYGDGGVRFCPRIEVNARYSMAWSLAWGLSKESDWR